MRCRSGLPVLSEEAQGFLESLWAIVDDCYTGQAVGNWLLAVRGLIKADKFTLGVGLVIDVGGAVGGVFVHSPQY